MKAEDLNKFKGLDEIKLTKPTIFQVLGIKKDTDNDGRLIIPNQTIRPFDIIVRDGEVHQIACIERIGEKGEAVFHRGINFNAGNHGRIHLDPSVPGDHSLYKFLMLTNQNLSVKDRDKTIEPLFKLVNEEEDAVAKLKVESHNKEAMDTFFKLKDQELFVISKCLGVGGEGSVQKLNLIEWLKEKPNAFLKIVDSIKEVVPEVELVQYGLETETLINDLINRKVLYGPDKNKVIHSYDGTLDEIALAQVLKKEYPEVLKALKTLSKS